MYRRYSSRLRQKIKLQPALVLDPSGEITPSEFLKTAELIKLEEAARASGFSTSYLRDIAQRGRLWAVKKGKNWFTTLAAIEEYKVNRYQVIKQF